jgi:diaminohydroxyphosphoribosylaminopyrimidine deaminase / 5-amino-6-(5-phosphoribosylamino)uracil reductase
LSAKIIFLKMQAELDKDNKFMTRAIELAQLGIGNVAPNPMVGCVIVNKGKIIGEGYHQEYGKAHAEVNAINSVKNRDLLSESTLYVNLEPCSHFGKTPPCTDHIIQKRIPGVVIGTSDPFDKVAGRGIEKLKNAGCNVRVGILEDKCKDLNRRFFTFHEKKRPYIILKWAQTEDGFIDIDRTVEYFGQPTWITNEISRIAVHKMRSEESAIFVGTNTALKDNPSLTVRVWSGKQPLRLVIDRNLRLPDDLELFNQKYPTIVFTSKSGISKQNLEYKEILFDGSEIEHILDVLHKRNVLSLIVEGGKELLQSFINKSLWDEAHIYIGRCLFQKGVQAPKIVGMPDFMDDLDGSSLYVYRNSLP